MRALRDWLRRARHEKLPHRWFERFRVRRTLGQRGEVAAARYLKGQGYTIVARGDRSPWGEIDLVAVDGRTVVFVEVKTRRSHDRGHPAEAVDLRKQRQITRAALAYLKRHQLLENACRFDVVAVTWPIEARRPTIEHFRSAFDAADRGPMFG
ncbi:MAG: YraN family protein [Pirellulales bacterium]